MSFMVVTACFIGKIQKNIAIFASKIIDVSYFPHIFSHVPSIFPTFPHMFRPFSWIFPACSMKKIHPFVAALLAWLCPEKSNCCTRTSRAAYASCFVIIKWYYMLYTYVYIQIDILDIYIYVYIYIAIMKIIIYVYIYMINDKIVIWVFFDLI